MDKKSFLESLDLFKEVYGEENEFRMCIEEMSELTKELCKFIRYSKNQTEDKNKLTKIKDNIVEETADVLNCVLQIKRIVGDETVEKIMAEKIAKETIVARKLKEKGDNNAN